MVARFSRDGDGQDEPPAPPCRSDDVVLSLRWERSGDALTGEVVAENVAGHSCRLGGKPTLTPLRQDGEPLPTQHTITLEARVPSFVVLQPGQRARARVSWGGWCGDHASGRVRVAWEGGSAVVDAQGPPQPECPGGGSLNTSSSWFDLLD